MDTTDEERNYKFISVRDRGIGKVGEPMSFIQAMNRKFEENERLIHEYKVSLIVDKSSLTFIKTKENDELTDAEIELFFLKNK